MFLDLRVRVCVHQDKQGKVQKVKAPNLRSRTTNQTGVSRKSKGKKVKH